MNEQQVKLFESVQVRSHWSDLRKKLGRSEKWIQQRMTGQETRSKLTDYWKTHDAAGADEFALL